MLPSKFSAGLVVGLALAACSTPAWTGKIDRWGGMREVMREGRTGGRVSLSAVARSSRTVAIGALEGLLGEVAIVDGAVWIARADARGVWFERGLLEETRAALLVATDVPRWRRIPIERDVERLDDFLAEIAGREALSRFRAWPFVIEGELHDLRAHVLCGACPKAGAIDPVLEPQRRSTDRDQGLLVGFHAADSAGELTHHGERSHVHVVIEREPFVGHVDSVAVVSGAVLRGPWLR